MKQFISLMLLCYALQSCRQINNSADVGSIYSALKSDTTEPQSIESAADGSALFTWNPECDADAVYFNIKSKLVEHFGAKPTETEFIFPGNRHAQSECWVIGLRTIVLQQDTDKVIKLTIFVQ